VNKLLSSFIFLFGIASSLQAGDGSVSSHAYQIYDVFGIPITNSMLTTWAFTIVIILSVKLLVGRPSLIPSRGQAFFESIYEGIESIVSPIVGRRMVPKALPLLLCLFLFIIVHNWTGLLPGVGAFGTSHASGHLVYFFRPANSDLNTTIALAVISMLAWGYLVFRYAGIKFFLYDIFGNKADKKETPKPLYFFLSLFFIVVGFIEIVSICIRPITLSMRLYGNIYGGESLLAKITAMVPWYIPAAFPFYLLETLVGLIQATVFILLVAVYIGLICNHEEEH